MSQVTKNKEKVAAKMNTETAIFSSACFWGTEFYFQKAPGVISTTVGYTRSSIENPTYEQVSTGRTGHAEAIKVTYELTKTSYENMVKLFYETHDQGQKDGQGPDVGTQYLCGIFSANEHQKAIAEKLTEELKRKGHKVVTELTKAGALTRQKIITKTIMAIMDKTRIATCILKSFDLLQQRTCNLTKSATMQQS